MVVPVPGRDLTREGVERCLVRLDALGFRLTFTSALAPDEQGPFLDNGFACHERLHLLGYDLSRSARRTAPSKIRARVPTPGGTVRLCRGRDRDVRAALEVDASAFDAFWRFDRAALEDARTATAFSRWRIARGDHVVGYAVTGRSGRYAYLQRLAVDSAHQNLGIGSALVVDALRWARRRGAREVLVNTQEANTGALELYERLGFVPRPQGLAVLRWSSDTPAGPP